MSLDPETPPPAVDPSARPRRAERAHWRELDDHVVILDVDSSVYLTLNSVGSLIWNEADGARTVEDLAAIVVDAFDVTPEVALRDSAQFVAAMVAEGLFET